MTKDLKTLAIEAALQNDWATAIKLNQEILSLDPNDVETLSRIAFAFMEKGELEKARKSYHKILSLDHFNPIAVKNLKKLSSLKPRVFRKRQNALTSLHANIANLFLEEPGKTKVVKLKNLAESHIISQLRPGDMVTLSLKRRSIFVLDKNVYLGALPDDVAHRLIRFMKHGNQYEAYVKSVERNQLTILIREVERASRFKNQPSFTNAPLSYLTSVREEALEDQEKPQVLSLEEMEEEGETEEEEETP